MADTSIQIDGQTVLIDEESAHLLHQFRWHISRRSRGRAYVFRKCDEFPSTRYLHREILGATAGTTVDHRNGDGLDNRRANLRLATRSEQLQNTKKSKGSSRYKGVHWYARKRRWAARIERVGCRRSLGYFRDEAAAAAAYDNAAREMFGAFACLNFPQDGERSCL